MRTVVNLGQNAQGAQVDLAGSIAPVTKHADDVLVDVTEDIKDAAAECSCGCNRGHKRRCS